MPRPVYPSEMYIYEFMKNEMRCKMNECAAPDVRNRTMAVHELVDFRF